MSAGSPDQETSLPTTQTSDSLSTASVLHWIQTLRTLPDLPNVPAYLGETPIRGTKRCRSLDSIPSDFLGNRPSFKKPRGLEQAGDLLDMGDYKLPTPSTESLTDSRTESPLKSSSTSNTNPHTPKRQKISSDQDAIGYRMSLHGLMQNEEVFDNEATFKAHVTNIVSADRSSTMKDTSVKKFREYLKVYERSNETTFLHHMIPILQGDGYHIAVCPEFNQTEERQSEEEGRKWRSFLSDEKIKNTLNQDFARTLLPSKFYDDPSLIKEMTKELAKDKDMTNPRPDYCFGFQRERYSLANETKIPQHILDLLEIAPGMHHVFLIFEGKSHSGSSAKAENQACRGGATLVNGLRTLYAELEKDSRNTAESRSTEKDPPTEEVEKDATSTVESHVLDNDALKKKSTIASPDYNSFVFSVTMSPTIFQIWVHWYDQASTLFHMNSVESFAIKNTKGPPQIRWALHNIIEWASVTRHEKHKALVESIKTYARRRKQVIHHDKSAGQNAATSSQGVAQMVGSRSKKRSRLDEDAD